MNLSEKLPLDALQLIANKKLSEISDVEILNRSIDEGFDYEKNDFSFGIEGGAGAIINVYNEPSDDDDNDVAKKLEYDGIFENQAVLNYNVLGFLKVKAGFEISLLDFGLEAEQRVAFGSYQIHDNQDGILGAVVNDVSDFQFILDKDHVLRLSDQEALSLSLGGFISTEAEVSFADVVMASLSQFSSLLNLTDALQLKIDSGIKVKFSMKIEDEFEVLIQKRGEGFKVSINKSIQKTLGAGVGVEVGIELKNPEVIDHLFAKVLDSAQNGLTEQLDKALEKATNELGESEVETIKLVAGILGIDVDGTVDSLKEEISDKRKELEESLTESIRSTIKVGVGFNYSRMKKTDALFSALFTAEALKQNHKSIIALKIDDLLQAEGVSGIAFERLTEIDIKRSSKVGISIGKWKLGQEVENTYSFDTHEVYRDEKFLFKVTEYELQKRIQITNNRSSQSNTLQFGGGMEKYVERGSEIKSSDFNYELGLSWTMKQGDKTKSHELKQILDFAICWDVVNQDSLNKAYASLEDILVKSKMKGITYEAHIKMPSPVYNLLIGEAANLTDADIANIMAESVPYADIKGRETLKERQFLYRDFWLNYLGENNPVLIDSDSVKDLFYRKFNEMDLFDLAGFESDNIGTTKYDKYKIYKLIEHNTIGDEFKAFKSSMSLLKEHFDSNYEHVLTKRSFQKDLTTIRLQPEYNMRVMGRMIHNLALKTDTLDKVNKGIEIKLPEKVDGEDTIIIAG